MITIEVYGLEQSLDPLRLAFNSASLFSGLFIRVETALIFISSAGNGRKTSLSLLRTVRLIAFVLSLVPRSIKQPRKRRRT
jgi:hypothetical protein